VPFHLGSEYIVPDTRLSGDSMYFGYFTPDYYALDMFARLSPAKTSFTVVSTAVKYSPAITYRCKNVFTKRLILSVEEKLPK
jgi:hypothetical protein